MSACRLVMCTSGFQMSLSSSWPNSTNLRAGCGMADKVSMVVKRVTECVLSSTYSISYIFLPLSPSLMLKIVAEYVVPPSPWNSLKNLTTSPT